MNSEEKIRVRAVEGVLLALDKLELDIQQDEETIRELGFKIEAGAYNNYRNMDVDIGDGRDSFHARLINEKIALEEKVREARKYRESIERQLNALDDYERALIVNKCRRNETYQRLAEKYNVSRETARRDYRKTLLKLSRANPKLWGIFFYGH